MPHLWRRLPKNAWILLLLPALWLWFPGLASLRELPAANDIFCSDFMHLNLPLKAELAAALHRGALPLWSPGIGTGLPLLAEGQVGALYPPNWLLFGMLPLGAALAATALLHLLLAGVGSFFLMREHDIEPVPALLGVLVFVFGAFFVEHLKHLNMLQSAAWLPWALWCVQRSVRRRDLRWLLAAGAIVALQLLAGHAQIAWISGLTVGAAILSLPLRARPAPSWTFAIRGALLAGAASTLLSAAQTLPTYELARQSYHAAVTFEWATVHALAPHHLVTLLRPFAFGNPALGTARQEIMPFWENWLYIGLLPLAFALLGLTLSFLRRRLRWFAVAVPVCVLLSLGASGGLYHLAYALPGGAMFQFPQRFLLVSQLGLAVLAAFGLQELLAWARWRLRWRRAAPLLAGGVLLAAGADLYAADASLVATLPARPWLQAPPFAQVMLPGIAGYRVFPILPEQLHNYLYWKTPGWQGDGARYLRHKESLQPDLNLVAGVPTVTAYVALQPRELREVWGDQSAPGLVQRHIRQDGKHLVLQPRARELLDLYSVRYLTAVVPLADPALRELATDGPYRLFENPTALPRARVEQAQGSARLVQDAPEKVTIDADLQAPGLLVLADLHYPGWRATLDGRDVPTLRVHDTMRGVQVGPGAHRIVFGYDPASFWLGLAISSMALLGGLGCLHWLRPVEPQ